MTHTGLQHNNVVIGPRRRKLNGSLSQTLKLVKLKMNII